VRTYTSGSISYPNKRHKVAAKGILVDTSMKCFIDRIFDSKYNHYDEQKINRRRLYDCMASIKKNTKKNAGSTRKGLVIIEIGSLLLVSCYCRKFKLVSASLKYVAVSFINIYADMWCFVCLSVTIFFTLHVTVWSHIILLMLSFSHLYNTH
jgi:hypothetical protein